MKYWLILFALLTFFGCKQKAPEKKTITLLKGDFTYRTLSKQEQQVYTTKANEFYERVLKRNRFNGSILVAKNGEIIFEAYEGYSNFATKDTITPTTAFHLASISKTFTGMAVLRLMEQNKLSLEDSLQQYFPQFPYHQITIKQLLTHRSGLPNYVYFMDTAWNKNIKATNDDMLQFMINKQPALEALPNKSFHYCNTNYALLALIVEKVTKQPFPQYLKDSLFLPLGMNNSFVFSVKDTANYVPSYLYNNTPCKLENIDCIYGDKNVYSTPRDMLLWDKAMYSGAFVSKPTLEKAFTPYSNEKKSFHNYGLGWRLFIDNNEKIVYHNGWWHGNNTVFTRLVNDTATIIAIGNRYNRIVYLSRQLSTIFNDKNKDQKLEE